MRQNILEVVFHYAPGPRIVLTRVCVALSALVIHLVTDYWETAVKDIIDTLRNVEVLRSSCYKLFKMYSNYLSVWRDEYSGPLCGAVRDSDRLARRVPDVAVG